MVRSTVAVDPSSDASKTRKPDRRAKKRATVFLPDPLGPEMTQRRPAVPERDRRWSSRFSAAIWEGASHTFGAVRGYLDDLAWDSVCSGTAIGPHTVKRTRHRTRSPTLGGGLK